MSRVRLHHRVVTLLCRGRQRPHRFNVYLALLARAVPQQLGVRACFACDATLAEAAGLPATASGRAQVRRCLRELAARGLIVISNPQARWGRGFRGGKVRVIVLAEVSADGHVQAPDGLLDPGTTITVFGRDFAVAELGLHQPLEAGRGDAEVFARSASNIRSVSGPSMYRQEESPYGSDASRRGDTNKTRSPAWPSGWRRLCRFERVLALGKLHARVGIRDRLDALSDRELDQIVAAVATVSQEPWVQDRAAFVVHLLLNDDRWRALRRDPANAMRPPSQPSRRRDGPDLSRIPDFLRFETEADGAPSTDFWAARGRFLSAARHAGVAR